SPRGSPAARTASPVSPSVPGRARRSAGWRRPVRRGGRRASGVLPGRAWVVDRRPDFPARPGGTVDEAGGAREELSGGPPTPAGGPAASPPLPGVRRQLVERPRQRAQVVEDPGEPLLPQVVDEPLGERGVGRVDAGHGGVA